MEYVGSPRLLLVAVALLSAGCPEKAPATTILPFNDPACASTKSGNACLTLEFTVSDSVQQSAGARCKRALHWGLYRGGDVGLLGPGSNHSVQGGTISSVDLSVNGASSALTLPDIDARSYQALAFISQSEDASAAVPGDPVTFPSDPFDVPANEHTQASVVFDDVR